MCVFLKKIEFEMLNGKFNKNVCVKNVVKLENMELFLRCSKIMMIMWVIWLVGKIKYIFFLIN